MATRCRSPAESSERSSRCSRSGPARSCPPAARGGALGRESAFLRRAHARGLRLAASAALQRARPVARAPRERATCSSSATAVLDARTSRRSQETSHVRPRTASMSCRRDVLPRRVRSGAGRLWLTSSLERSDERRPTASRSCGYGPSSCASTRSSRSAATSRPSERFSRSSLRTRTARGSSLS